MAETREPGGADAILDRLLALHPKRIDLSLDRLTDLLSKLGDPHHALPRTVHVAGTNGKGSVCAYLAAGLGHAGGRVHVYTSPHLVRFHERIVLNGVAVDEAHLADALDRCERANDGAPITFFEITTAAAFLLFAETPADHLVLEVGLGGRLDATNVIPRAALSAITPVSFDHQEFLGVTLAEIATEKAGILRRDTPAILARQTDEAEVAILRRAGEVAAPLVIEGRDWSTRREHGRLVFEDAEGLVDLPSPRLLGAHQTQNAGVAIALLRGLGCDEEVLAAAMTQATWSARLQRLRDGPLLDALPAAAELWLDGGHNAAAAHAVAHFFAEREDRGAAPLHLICGMMKSKDAESFLQPFAGLARRVYAVEIEGENGAASSVDIAQAAVRAGHEAVALGSARDAVRAIASEADKLVDEPPRVLICGSLYLAGRILADHR